MPTSAIFQQTEASKEDGAVLPFAAAGGGGDNSGGAQDVIVGCGGAPGGLGFSSEEVRLKDPPLATADDVDAAAAALADGDVEEAKTPPQQPQRNLREAVQIASQIQDESIRERALLEALKDCRRDLEDAEVASARANDRLLAAREVYDRCAKLLAGYTPLETRLGQKKKRSGVGMGSGGGGSGSTVAKRGKSETAINMDGAEVEASAAAASAFHSTNAPLVAQIKDEAEEVAHPTNEICLPEYITSFHPKMNEEQIANFRDAFYLKLTKGQADASNSDNWNPPPNNANLKSKSQLAEWIHICQHWNTGADGLDAGAFRAKHKTWYARMKPVTCDLGRRTGLHLRQLDDGMTVLCRYNKVGNKSVVYLDVGRLFDALFQIHVVELDHRGRDATKNLADERYANTPDATVRAFLDTCPHCSNKRRNKTTSMEAPVHLQPTMGV